MHNRSQGAFLYTIEYVKEPFNIPQGYVKDRFYIPMVRGRTTQVLGCSVEKVMIAPTFYDAQTRN